VKPVFAGLLFLLLTACSDSADVDSTPDAEQESDSVFSVYLSAVDKAKAAQQAAGDRQRQLDATLGFEDSSAEGQYILGMTNPESGPEYGTASGDEGVFDGAVTSMNKARATRDMLNNRQRKLDAMWGIQSQSTSGAEFIERPTAELRSDTDSEGMTSIIDRAKQAQQSANERERNLEAT